jgi:two-component system, NtrC family, nitrogen regulation response regulator GlnG
MSNIWIADDEPSICFALRKSFELDRHRVRVFATADLMLDALVHDHPKPDVVLLDIRMPGTNGLDALKAFKRTLPNTPVIIMTAFGDLQSAVQAIQGNAFDYLTKPFNLDEAIQIVSRAIDQQSNSSPTADTSSSIPRSLGKSPEMQRVYKQIAIAASNDSIVLVEGERGSGKTLIADMIHRHSSRKNESLLTTPLGSDNQTDWDFEVFGVRTGPANEELRCGLMELSQFGTLIIDEVGMIPLASQTKLLRAIESKSFQRLRDAESMGLTSRLIFSTSHDLEVLVKEGELQKDLASLIDVQRIQIPPLRNRLEDVPELVQAFLSVVDVPTAIRISDEAMHSLKQRPWYGNIRELRNAVQRAATIAKGGIIQIDDLQFAGNTSAVRADCIEIESRMGSIVSTWLSERLVSPELQPPEAIGNVYDDYMSLVEPPLLEQMMDHFDGNRASVASALGLHRTTVRQKMKRYHIGD